MSDKSKAVQDANAAVQADANAAGSVKNFSKATTDWITTQDPVPVTPPPDPTPVPPTPVPPTPSGKLVVYGVCPGASSHAWSDADHAFYTGKLKELAQGKPFYVRVIAGDNARTDRDVNKFHAAGLTPYLCLYGTTGPIAPTSMPRTLAARYKGSGVIYTGINEPDINGWQPNPLADFQKALYDYVKEGDSAALCGSPAYWKGSPNSFAAWQAHIKALVARAKGKFDFLATHCGYDDPAVTAAGAASWNYWHWNFKKYKTLGAGQTAEELLAAAGINVPIISDEGGSKGTEQQMQEKTMRLLNATKSGTCASQCIYTVEPDVPGYQFLFRADKTATPVYNSFKQFMATV